MPSWNIHCAHAEKLLADHGAAALGIRDENAFLFGNYVPDIYVGYLVEPISCWIDYKDTHLARKAYIPLPDCQRFWHRYVEPYADPPELVLGAWCHLMCDRIYNARVRAYIKSVGVRPGEITRIGKQRDFDAFGHTLAISHHVQATPELIAQAEAFPQYAICEEDTSTAVDAANDFVDDNQEHFLEELPPLTLLTPEFFSEAFAAADRACCEGLLALAARARGA